MAPRKVTKNGREKWLADLRGFGGGRKYCDTEEEAQRLLSKAEKDRANFGKLAIDLDTRVEFLRIQTKLVELGATLAQVVDFWERTHKPAARKPIAEAARECLAAKEAAGRRKRSIQQLRYSLESFAKSVGELPCSDITHEHVEKWLNNPDWSMRTRHGQLINLRTFFAFAMKPGRAWMVLDPSAAIEQITLDKAPPGILTVDQVKRLLSATQKHRPTFLPFIVLGVFAGVRPDEMKQLSWQHVNLQTGYCEIPAHIAKRVKGGGSRQRRLIQLQPNALAWLKLGGDLPPLGWQDRWDYVRKAAGFAVTIKRKGRRVKSKGEPWPKNAMRHSFCSYCLPVFGELKESEWAGHSPQMAISSYRELVTLEAAREFWSITPESITKSPAAST